MQKLSSSMFNGAREYGGLARFWKRRRGGYMRLEAANRKNVKVVRFGGNAKKSWRLRVMPKLRWRVVSPVKLWRKLKGAYMNMMLSLAGNVGHLHKENLLIGGKSFRKASRSPGNYFGDEFEERLIYEIYKSLVASRELYSTA